jgi:ABC-type nitrate/sulfonate/bicarbonate transport system substrate-binding protein
MEDLMRVSGSGMRFMIGAVVSTLIAAGCSAGATPTPTGPFKIHLQLTPSHVAVAVADDQGFFKGVDVDWQLVGYGESSQLFHAGTDPIGNESPWEAATYQDQGKDIRYFSTVEAENMSTGVIIRTEDKAKYPDLKSLKGKKLGMPGFGTGTWAAFQTIAKGQYGLDALKDFQPIEGNPGDLEGLLQTKSIDAMITFTAQAAHAVSNPAYTMLYNITDAWQKANGAYLPINGWIADAKWLDDHLEIVKNFIAGVDQGLAYYKQHMELDDPGAKFADFAQNEGRISPEVSKVLDPWIKDGYFLLGAKDYNKAWAEGVYKFIQLGEGVLVKKVPTIDKVFYDKTYS